MAAAAAWSAALADHLLSPERHDQDIAAGRGVAVLDPHGDLIDRILMPVERDVSILRLDDEDESPFVIQEALKGIHLVDPDPEVLFNVSRRVLHESESIRFRREHACG